MHSHCKPCFGFGHTDADVWSATPGMSTQYFFPYGLGYTAWCEICCLKSVSDFASLLLQAAWCAQDVILVLAPVQCSSALAPVLCQSRVEATLKSFGELRDIGGVQWISFPISGLRLWLHFMAVWGTVCWLMRSKASTSSWWDWSWQETTSTKGKKPYFGHANNFHSWYFSGLAKHIPHLASSKVMGISDSMWL